MSYPARPTLAARAVTFGDLTIVPAEIIAVHLRKPEGLPHWWVEVWTRAYKFEIGEREGVTTNDDAQRIYDDLAERMGAR